MNMIVGLARYLNFFKKESKLVPYWIIQKYPLTLKTIFKPSFLEITSNLHNFSFKNILFVLSVQFFCQEQSYLLTY